MMQERRLEVETADKKNRSRDSKVGEAKERKAEAQVSYHITTIVDYAEEAGHKR
jgi:hypothetical protein